MVVLHPPLSEISWWYYALYIHLQPPPRTYTFQLCDAVTTPCTYLSQLCDAATTPCTYLSQQINDTDSISVQCYQDIHVFLNTWEVALNLPNLLLNFSLKEGTPTKTIKHYILTFIYNRKFTRKQVQV